MEKRVDDFVIHARTHSLPSDRPVRHAVAVLGRIGRVRDEMTFAVVNKVVEQKLRGFLHDGIRFVAQEGTVEAELVVLPEVQRHPCAAHRPYSAIRIIDGCGIAPGIQIVMKHKTACAVHFLRRTAAAGHVRLDPVEKRPGRLWQISDLGRPVVHLDVDVRGVLAVPRRCHAFIPNALEIGRHRSRSAASHQQVASKLVIQSGESWIVLALSDPGQSLVCGKALD